MVQFTPATEVDFVIVGSGAAGAIMAKQLAVAGFTVVVLEQGGWGKYGHERDYTKDELLNDHPSLDDQLMSDPSRQRNTFRKNESEKAVPNSHSYGCVVGGGTVTYGGSSWRHLPWEFNEASTVGTIAGTGLADWPITYEELEPYYTQAEWEMGISGQRVDSPFVAPMSKDYPMPAAAAQVVGRSLLKTAAARLGLNVVPGPLAIISHAVSRAVGLRELRHVLRLRLPRPRPFQLGRHDAADRGRDRPLRDPPALATCARSSIERQRPRDGGRPTSTPTARKCFRRRRRCRCRRTDRKRRACS